MPHKKIIMIGAVVGVLCHIGQGAAAYLILDRFYLLNPDLVRDLGAALGLYYLVLNFVVGLVISYLTWLLGHVWDQPSAVIGFRAAFLTWAASSPVYILKRQLILDLSPLLMLEIITDLIIYSVIGTTAGLLMGLGGTSSGKDN